jgi:hypothetical protein
MSELAAAAPPNELFLLIFTEVSIVSPVDAVILLDEELRANSAAV